MILIFLYNESHNKGTEIPSKFYNAAPSKGQSQKRARHIDKRIACGHRKSSSWNFVKCHALKQESLHTVRDQNTKRMGV